jgi:hypothetical protein
VVKKKKKKKKKTHLYFMLRILGHDLLLKSMLQADHIAFQVNIQLYKNKTKVCDTNLSNII